MTNTSSTINQLIVITEGVYAYESDLGAPPIVTDNNICKTLPFYDVNGIKIGECMFNPCDDCYSTWKGEVNGMALTEDFWMLLNDNSKPMISQHGETVEIDGDTEDEEEAHGKMWRVCMFRGREIDREEIKV